MKKIYTLLTVAMLMVATNVSAQFVTSGGGSGKSTTTGGTALSNMSTDHYNRVYFSYNPTKITWAEHQSDWEEELPFKSGFTLGYLGGINLTKKAPLFVEMGANLQYSMGKYEFEEEFDYTTKVWMLSMNIPVNLAFKLSFADNKASVTPYVGLNFRANFAGDLTFMVEYGDGEDKESISLFDDDLEEQAFKPFQVGINAGVGFSYKALYLGVGYTTDFMKIANYDDGDYEGRFGNVSLTLGINF